MAIKLPTNSVWLQPNTSDKFGNLWATKNVNLDEEGYIKLSPRTVSLFDDSANVSNQSNTDFNFPVAFGRTGSGEFKLATAEEPFNVTLSETAKTIAEDETSNNPALAFTSHGTWWQGRFYESTDTAVYYLTGTTWTANAITGLTSNKRHYLEVFKNRNELCVANGNVVKQYNTSHSGTTDLTIPSDFEVVGLAYNNQRMGVITRLGSNSSSQNSNSYFFLWDGTTTSANAGFDLGAYQAVGVVAYKSSWLVLTSTGELLYFNGGGFDVLARFPFYYKENQWGDLLNFVAYGDNMVVEGDVVYINVGFELNVAGSRDDIYLVNNPSGVWCYDPKVGLYHRYSGSQSPVYLHTISQANVNTTTDLFTTSSNIPDTGNPVILSSGTVGGLNSSTVYYVIKVSSTTFRLAETKEKALAGDYINITSADTNQYFWLFDIKDYGVGYNEKTGAIALYGTSSGVFRDVVFGGRYLASDLTSQINLCSCFPFLENRGYFITPKVFSGEVQDTFQKVFVKFRPLRTEDKIIVKTRKKDVLGFPISQTDNRANAINWTSPREGYTTTDLSAAKTYLDNNGELELEVLAGYGAGQMVKITEINEEDGTYSFVLAEDVVGVTSGLISYFTVSNWETKRVITNADNDDGFVEVPLGDKSKWFQLKVELRGYETTVEELEIVNVTHKKSE